MCCAASLLLVRVVPAGEAGDHQMIAAPSFAALSKAQGPSDSTGWTSLQKDLLWASDHETYCVLLLPSNHKLHHFSITLFMCRKQKSSQNFKINILVYIIHPLNGDYLLGHCRRPTDCPTGLPSLAQGKGAIPCPTLPVSFLTDH